MKQHLHRDDLDKLRVGRLPAAEVLAITDHLAGCDECRETCLSDPATDDAGKRLLSVLGASHETVDHPDLDSRLFPYVDGTLRGAARDEVEAHLAACGMCRADVDELRGTRSSPPAERSGWTLTAAAAAMVAFITTLVWLAIPRRTPSPAMTNHAAVAPAMPAAWRDLVQSAVSSGRLDRPPVITALRPRAEVLRGAATKSRASLNPTGVVVEETRPHFSWGGVSSASFRVSVFDGDRLVAQSPVLQEATWLCDRDLARGRTYSWQVEVSRGDSREILPEPGQTAALFQVLDEQHEREVVAARQRFPADHLLTAVLYAHDGVRDRAEQELRLAQQSPAQTADARRFIDSLRDWD